MAGAHILNRLYSGCGAAISLLGNALVPFARSMGLAALSLKAARSSVIIPELPVSDVELFIKSVTKEENA